MVQKFTQPSEMKEINHGYLPRSSSCYLIHPCLHKIITEERNSYYAKNFTKVIKISVQNGAVWKDGYDQLLELYCFLEKSNIHDNENLLEKAIISISNEKIKEKDKIQRILEGIPSFMETAGRVANFTTTVIDLITRIGIAPGPEGNL
jgi:hypothetical protein